MEESLALTGLHLLLIEIAVGATIIEYFATPRIAEAWGRASLVIYRLLTFVAVATLQSVFQFSFCLVL